MRNKGCKDSLGGVDCTLSVEERTAFFHLQQATKVHFDMAQETHSRLLERLTFSVFEDKEATEVVAADFKSDGWAAMGFQGKDPRTDFRGAGVTGLR